MEGKWCLATWSQANEDKHTKEIVLRSIDEMQTRIRDISWLQAIKNMYQRTGGRGTPVTQDVKWAGIGVAMRVILHPASTSSW